MSNEPPKQQCRKGAVKINRHALNKAMSSSGKTINDIARAKGISVKTLKDLIVNEKRDCCFVRTIEDIANVINVSDYKCLIEGGINSEVEILAYEEAKSPPGENQSTNITIKFYNVNRRSSIDETEDLSRLLSQLYRIIGLSGFPVVIEIKSGSLDVTVSVSPSELPKLIAAPSIVQDNMLDIEIDRLSPLYNSPDARLATAIYAIGWTLSRTVSVELDTIAERVCALVRASPGMIPGYDPPNYYESIVELSSFVDAITYHAVIVEGRPLFQLIANRVINALSIPGVMQEAVIKIPLLFSADQSVAMMAAIANYLHPRSSITLGEYMLVPMEIIDMSGPTSDY